MPKLKLPNLNSRGNVNFILVLLIAVVVAVVGFVIYQTVLQNKILQQEKPKAPKKIGVIQNNRILQAYVDGLKEGMRDLGYEEGKDIIYDIQDAQSDVTSGSKIAQKFVQDSVDVIYAITAQAMPAVREATASGKTIPVVIMGIDRPDQRGLVKSLQSSGNHVTGVANNHQEYVAKRLEILRKIKPEAKKIGVFGQGFIAPGAGPFVFAELKKQAPNFDFTVVEYKIEGKVTSEVAEKEARRITSNIKQGEIDAIFHIPNHIYVFQDEIETEATRRLKIPGVSGNMAEVKGGGLFTYVSDFIDDGKQAAVMVDKILKGTKPADIPLEFPKKPLFVVNFKTAKEIDTTIPDSLIPLISRKIE